MLQQPGQAVMQTRRVHHLHRLLYLRNINLQNSVILHRHYRPRLPLFQLNLLGLFFPKQADMHFKEGRRSKARGKQILQDHQHLLPPQEIGKMEEAAASANPMITPTALASLVGMAAELLYLNLHHHNSLLDLLHSTLR